MRGSGFHRTHLVQLDFDAAARALPGCFAAGQTRADNFDLRSHLRQLTADQALSNQHSANLSTAKDAKEQVRGI